MGKEVDDLKDKLRDVKKRKQDIDRYVPEEYQTDALKAWKRKVERLEAELKATEDDIEVQKKADAEKPKTPTGSDATPPSTALLARTNLNSRSLEAEADHLQDKLRD